MTIIVGHATFCVVVVYNNVVARLRRLPRTAEEASADLGADSFTTFRRDHPARRCGTALMSGGLLAFGLSFDEIIVTIFTAGAGTQTLPMWIYSAHPAARTSCRWSTSSPWCWSLISIIPVYHRFAHQQRCRRRAPALNGPGQLPILRSLSDRLR